jgi:protein-S-isoprenylcysteine O-methyltransferase Ste14
MNSLVLALKNVLFTVLVPGTVAVVLPWTLGRAVDSSSGASLVRWIAIVPWLLGAAVYFWCLWDFATAGQGTPAPIDAPKKLVVRGLYRAVRNPMYIGVLLVIAGWALWYTSWSIVVYGLVAWTLAHLFVVYVEEPSLHHRFGRPYIEYCGKARRWLPRWPGPLPGETS